MAAATARGARVRGKRTEESSDDVCLRYSAYFIRKAPAARCAALASAQLLKICDDLTSREIGFKTA